MNRREMIRAMGAGAAAVALSEGRALSAPGPDEATPAAVPATRASPGALRKLPTSIRPIVDAADVLAPEGYRVDPVLVGLNFPCGMDVADDGSVFIIEGGCTWPTRPVLPPRVLRFRPSGTLEVFAEEEFAPRGVACHGDAIYVSLKGGYHTRFVRYDLKTRARKVVVDGLPDGGWHEPGGPVFGPDGRMYIAQGSVTLHGAVEPAGFTVDVAKHPYAFDVPGQDITLTGSNVWSRDPTAPFPYLKETGPFKPFGVPARKGEVIPGQLKCSTGVWRCQPDGSELELLAWGIRNPYGLAINEAGELYASDNDFEEKGDRSIAEDPDRIWLIRNSRTAPGSVRAPDWYGFPDIAADGLPVWHERHRPLRGTPAEPFLLNPPPWAGPPALLFEPHTGLSMMDFCPSDAFGARGELFVALFGTYAPLNTPRPEALNRGFQVVRVNTQTRQVVPFLRNKKPGPASRNRGTGGLERPVDCKFGPDGKTLYVLDFGVNHVEPTHVVAYGHTGVLWRVTRTS